MKQSYEKISKNEFAQKCYFYLILFKYFFLFFAGGYQCRCRPSHRRPNNVRRSYLGEIIERATPKQYYSDFNCKKVGFIQRLPQQWEIAPKWLRDQYLEQYFEYKNYSEDATPGIGT